MEGKDVTIVEMLPDLCPTALLDNRNPLLFRLRDNHVKQLTSTKIKEVKPEGVLVEGPDGEIFCSRPFCRRFLAPAQSMYAALPLIVPISKRS